MRARLGRYWPPGLVDLAAYADLLAQAVAVARPGYLDNAPAVVRFEGADDALAWLDEEFRSVGGLIVQAGSTGTAEAVALAARMLHCVQWYLRSRGHWQVWRDAAAAVIDGSVRTDDAGAELIGHQSNGLLAQLTGRFDECDACLTAAVQLAERLDNPLEMARVLNRRGLRPSNAATTTRPSPTTKPPPPCSPASATAWANARRW